MCLHEFQVWVAGVPQSWLEKAMVRWQTGPDSNLPTSHTWQLKSSRDREGEQYLQQSRIHHV